MAAQVRVGWVEAEKGKWLPYQPIADISATLEFLVDVSRNF